MYHKWKEEERKEIQSQQKIRKILFLFLHRNVIIDKIQ